LASVPVVGISTRRCVTFEASAYYNNSPRQHL
jgi:hypothetical protein